MCIVKVYINGQLEVEYDMPYGDTLNHFITMLRNEYDEQYGDSAFVDVEFI